MPLTNFQNGITSFGVPVMGGASVPTTTGKYLFVCSVNGGTGAGRGQSPDTPFSTVAEAMANCTANKGDCIVIMPGHVETISAASGLTLSVAGVTLIGLGNGSNRPTFTLSATAATILISGANITLANVIITSSVDELVTCISVTAAGVTLDTVDYVDGSAVQTLSFLTTSAAADDLTIKNCTHVQGTAPATAAAWISLIGTDRVKILGNIFRITQANSASSFVIQSLTTAPLNITIDGNTIVQLGGATIAAAITLVAGTTGFVSNNQVGSTATSQATAIALASCYGAQNFATNVVNTQGILVPAADS